MADLAMVLIIIAVALIFDFINGFHDSANSIAKIVATNVLKPRTAVLLAAFWNFFGGFIFTVAVASTIGKNVIDPNVVTIPVILAALLGAIAWNLITWYFGIPSSSSHALIGGLIGAGIAGAGLGAVHFLGLKLIFIFIILAPLIGFVCAILLTVAMMWLLRRASPR